MDNEILFQLTKQAAAISGTTGPVESWPERKERIARLILEKEAGVFDKLKSLLPSTGKADEVVKAVAKPAAPAAKKSPPSWYVGTRENMKKENEAWAARNYRTQTA